MQLHLLTFAEEMHTIYLRTEMFSFIKMSPVTVLTGR